MEGLRTGLMMQLKDYTTGGLFFSSMVQRKNGSNSGREKYRVSFSNVFLYVRTAHPTECAKGRLSVSTWNNPNAFKG